jgi:hypothetical protein
MIREGMYILDAILKNILMAQKIIPSIDPNSRDVEQRTSSCMYWLTRAEGLLSDMFGEFLHTNAQGQPEVLPKARLSKKELAGLVQAVNSYNNTRNSLVERLTPTTLKDKEGNKRTKSGLIVP